MTESLDLLFSEEEFSGKARLFPLPGTVLFPHVMQPLHIFEPRYCDLLQDALAGDRLIALAGLEPGWEPHYEGRPPLYPVACLAKITSHQSQPDGRHNVLLLGVRRVRIVREFPPERSYREAEVAIVDDVYPPADAGSRAARQQSLVSLFHRLTPNLEMPDPLEKLLSTDLPLGALADLMSYALDLSAVFKQQLLTEANVDRRAEMLIEHFEKNPGRALRESLDFPPKFSDN